MLGAGLKGWVGLGEVVEVADWSDVAEVEEVADWSDDAAQNFLDNS